MKRFWTLFINEFKLARTAVPSHIVAVIQPTILYLFMGAINKTSAAKCSPIPYNRGIVSDQSAGEIAVTTYPDDWRSNWSALWR